MQKTGDVGNKRRSNIQEGKKGIKSAQKKKKKTIEKNNEGKFFSLGLCKTRLGRVTLIIIYFYLLSITTTTTTATPLIPIMNKGMRS